MILTLAEYLALHVGMTWTQDDSDYILRHVREVETTALAVAEMLTRRSRELEGSIKG